MNKIKSIICGLIVIAIFPCVASNAAAQDVKASITLAEKNSFPVAPETFGAVADGVTDDSAAIQSAIDTGKTVQLNSEKTYLIDATLNVATGTTIIGNGGTLTTGATLAASGGDESMISLSSDNNVTIEGVRFTGTPFARFITISTSRALAIESCIFEDAGVAILAADLTQSSIVNNRFYNFTANQIYVRQGCVGNTISNNVFDDKGAHNTNNHTIDIEANAGENASTGNTISGNSVQSCGTPCQLTGTQCSGNTVSGNTFINTSGDRSNGNGFKTSNAGRNTVSNNTISGPLYGINEASQGGTFYTGNTIIGRFGFSLNNGSTTTAGPSSIVGNVILADEPGVHSGIAQAGTPSASEITLQGTATSANRSIASSSDDAYNNKLVTITGGTGSGQSTTIVDYTGATKIADVSPSWSPTPDATSTYDVSKVTGTCQAGSTSSTIKLATTASATDDSFNNERAKITGGTGTLGEFRRIVDYTGSTRVADVEPDWTVTPDGTTTYEVSQTIDGINVNTPGHTINGNTIKDFHVDGLDGESASATDMKIIGNHFVGIGRYGFRIDSDDNYLSGNVISDGIQTLYGAFVAGDNNVILDTDFSNNLGGSGAGTSRDFMHFSGGTGNEVRMRNASFIDSVAAGSYSIDGDNNTVIVTGSSNSSIATTLTTDMESWDVSLMDSSGGAIAAVLGSGGYVGEIKTIAMTDAANSSTVTITNHETEDAEVATFDAVDETGVFMWTGTEWVTISASCTFL